MAVLRVPSAFSTIQSAVDAAVGGTAGSGSTIGDIIQIDSGYAGPKTATVTKENLLFRVANDVQGIVLTLANGISDLRLNSASQTSTSNVTVFGNNGANTIFGNEGSNTLHGLGGQDTLDGGAGNDFLYGGGGSDFLRGGLGDDLLDGGEGNDWADYRNATGSVTVTLTDGVDGGPTGGSSSGADGNDTLVSIENIRGGAFNDILTGNSGANNLRGGGGADVLNGGGGIDYADYRFSPVGLTVSLADPSLNTGEAAGDTYISIEGIVGSSFDDTLYGDANNNRLDGGEGADILNGGAGFDYARYSNSSIGITASLANPSINTGEAEGDVYISIEGLQGSLFDDFLYGDDGDNILVGNAGADHLDGGSGIDVASYDLTGQLTGVTASLADPSGNTGHAAGDTYVSIEGLTGSNFADTLTGDDSDNTLNGVGGDDILYGLGGRDVLIGGAGNDSLYGGDGNDILRGGTGNDLLHGGRGVDRADYRDAAGSVTVTLTDGVNGGPTGGFSSGADGNDTLISIEHIRGGAYNDVLTGNSETNHLRGGGGADVLNGGDGNDYADYRDSTQGLIVSLANPSLNTGEAAGDTYNSIESLIGSNFADTLYGDANNNRLDGAGGADILDGGAGIDIARYVSSSVGVTVSLANPALNTGDAQGDVYISIEGLQGSEFDDFLYGDAGDNILIGDGGADYLDGGDGFDIASYRTGRPETGVLASLANPSLNTGDAQGDIYVSIEGLAGSMLDDVLIGDNSDNMLDGWRGNDVLYGGGGNDTLDGGDGADSMHGGTGDDTYFVDNVGDRVFEAKGEGTDTVFSSVTFSLAGQHVENLTLTGTSAINGTGNSLANVLIGNSAANILNGGTGADTMRGGAGDDTYYVDNAGDRVFEKNGEGTDTVFSSVTFSLAGQYIENLTLTGTSAINGTGNSLANVLVGNSAANILNGGSGADTMRGGAGDDTYIVDNAGDQVIEFENEGVDLVQSSVSLTLGANIENLTLTGSSAINGTGNSLNNVLIGNSAANILNGGSGADTMRGGAGDDTYIVDNAADQVIELENEGVDLVQSSVSLTLGANLENLTLTGTSAINGTGNSLDNVLIGNSAANVLDGRAGADTMRGGAGDDTYYVDDAGDRVFEKNGEGTDIVFSSVTFSLAGQYIENLTLTGTSAINGTGNSLDNILIGNSAANILNGGTGADIMRGGAGDDTYYVDNAGDRVFEAKGEGTDTVFSSVTFSLAGQYIENLTLTGTSAINGTGNSLANVLVGNSAANVLNGGTGADTMRGGAGDDTYIVDNVGDRVIEKNGEGTDIVFSSVTFSLAGQYIENLTLTGTSAINATGNSLANVLIGNSAANVLNGGSGNDTLTGGLGADKFVFNTALNATSNIDFITDFTPGEDTILLENAVFAELTTTGVLAADAFFIGAAAHDADDRIIYDSTSGALFYDADGNGAGAAIQFATLSPGLTSLTHADFLVI